MNRKSTFWIGPLALVGLVTIGASSPALAGQDDEAQVDEEQVARRRPREQDSLLGRAFAVAQDEAGAARA